MKSQVLWANPTLLSTDGMANSKPRRSGGFSRLLCYANTTRGLQLDYLCPAWLTIHRAYPSSNVESVWRLGIPSATRASW